MADRAYSLISVKSLDDERREFSGLATAPAHDRVQDSIDPLGCRFKNPLVLLRAHDHTMPIGECHFDRPTRAGITFKARIPKIPEPGLLKDRVDMAWGELKHGLIRSVSVGFRPTKDPKPNEKGGLDWPGVEIFELSTVAVPAQELATIDQVKAIDAAIRRGETPATATGSLWARIGRIGLQALDDFEAGPDYRALGKHGPNVATARSAQEMIKALCTHIDGLEGRLADNPIRYRGIWKPGTYPAGSFVTHGGSMWHADQATDFKPGEGGGWTLAVKRGVDAKERA